MLVITPANLEMTRWRLMWDVIIQLESGRRFIIPAGFVTDFASVPRCFWFILPPMGRYGKAALLHDWLYYTKYLPRSEADRVFLEVMLMMGVRSWKAYVMYSAVRLFGWIKWKSSNLSNKSGKEVIL